MKKLLSLALTLLLLAIAPAVSAEAAEPADLADGVETLALDNGISLTYNKYDFKVDVDENGNVTGLYLGETPAPVGFSIEAAAGTDAEAYMTAAAAAHSAELCRIAAFDEGNEWLSFDYSTEAPEEYTCQVTVYARNFDGGCYIVTAYCCYESDAEQEAETDEEVSEVHVQLEQLLDSLRFTK